MLYFQYSHPVKFRPRCGFELHPLRGWFVSARTVYPVPMYRNFGCRFLPAFLPRHHRLRPRSPTHSSFGFGQFLVCRSGCRAVSHPIGRTFRPILSGSDGFWVLFRHLLLPYLFGSSSRSETVVPKYVSGV